MDDRSSESRAGDLSSAKSKKLGVLFVCTGNICRSPTAEGVFRHVIEKAGLEQDVHVASAGTHDYHVGEPPDRRTQQAARARGYDLSTLRAQRVCREDFACYDFVLAMDRTHLAILTRLKPSNWDRHLGLFLDFASHLGIREMPDPYYGCERDFEQVLDLVEAGARGLCAVIQKQILAR